MLTFSHPYSPFPLSHNPHCCRHPAQPLVQTVGHWRLLQVDPPQIPSMWLCGTHQKV